MVRARFDIEKVHHIIHVGFLPGLCSKYMSPTMTLQDED
jgi:hypothetical protein